MQDVTVRIPSGVRMFFRKMLRRCFLYSGRKIAFSSAAVLTAAFSVGLANCCISSCLRIHSGQHSASLLPSGSTLGWLIFVTFVWEMFYYCCMLNSFSLKECSSRSLHVLCSCRFYVKHAKCHLQGSLKNKVTDSLTPRAFMTSTYAWHMGSRWYT